ncbi:hypothetical protein Cantr_02284 [Candida viswanathii]|uniref:Uncharacterized protein n=1 Tax=Candida viswanathii TaxID=5486 RepID=A0A367YLJ6_9ASCO|nr:hypothetical protein Cantr_02284 [Candida viswanathii]
MIANSTHIANRMFRSQRIVILAILASFLVLLGITGATGHHHQVVASVKSAGTKASDTLSGIYKAYAMSPAEQELALEAEAEAEKLEHLAQEKQEEVKEEKAAKAQEKLEDEQIKQEEGLIN